VSKIQLEEQEKMASELAGQRRLQQGEDRGLAKRARESIDSWPFKDA